MTSQSDSTVPGPLLWSGRLLVLFALLMLVNGVIATLTDVAAGLVDVLFAAALLVATSGVAYGLRRRSWAAWFAGVVLAAVGLFFLAPVVGTMLLGGGLDPVGTGWDVAYFPLLTLTLVAALAGLHRSRHALGGKPPAGEG